MRPCFLVVDKAPGLTSHDVVAMVRAVTGLKKVGHTGTLDPFASGVLVLALGGATRFIQYLDERLKVYDATIALGAATTTGDPEGEVSREGPPADFGRLDEVLAGFVGPQMQVPPAYSAVKVKGKPLYRYARQGKEVKVDARPVEIFGLEAIEHGEDWLRVHLRCSRGTYARVLADDIATALGTAGHLRALRRLQSGPFTLPGALSLKELGVIAAGTEDWRRALRPARGADRVPWRPRSDVAADLAPRSVSLVEALSHLPTVSVGRGLRDAIVRGGAPARPPADLEEGGRYLVVHGEEVVALVERRGAAGRALLTVRGG